MEKLVSVRLSEEGGPLLLSTGKLNCSAEGRRHKGSDTPHTLHHPVICLWGPLPSNHSELLFPWGSFYQPCLVCRFIANFPWREGKERESEQEGERVQLFPGKDLQQEVIYFEIYSLDSSSTRKMYVSKFPLMGTQMKILQSSMFSLYKIMSIVL